MGGTLLPAGAPKPSRNVVVVSETTGLERRRPYQRTLDVAPRREPGGPVGSIWARVDERVYGAFQAHGDPWTDATTSIIPFLRIRASEFDRLRLRTLISE